MTQLTIEIPEADAAYLKTRASEENCGSLGELLSRMIQEHRERESLEEKILAGDLADDGDPPNAEFFESLRTRISEIANSKLS